MVMVMVMGERRMAHGSGLMMLYVFTLSRAPCAVRHLYLDTC